MITREIERMGIPIIHITSIMTLSKQVGANRIVAGTNIPYPCGDPNLPAEGDRSLRKEIIRCALGALQTGIQVPTIFFPNIVGQSS
jgi:glycine reductase